MYVCVCVYVVYDCVHCEGEVERFEHPSLNTRVSTMDRWMQHWVQKRW